MKELFACIFTFAFSVATAQTKVTKYYDANWSETTKEKAAFYADFIKDGSYYNCSSYWLNTQIIRGKSIYPDTAMADPIGVQVLYYKDGHPADSSFFQDKQLKYSFHYYPNRQLAAHYFLPDNKKEGVSEGYDESGKKIKNYVYQKEAEFKGGQKAWVGYITKNVSKDFTVKGGSEEVTATVKIEFIVDENGDVVVPKIKISSGYKNVDNDALSVIRNSPGWNSAILYNVPVKAYRIQPFIYILKPEKK